MKICRSLNSKFACDTTREVRRARSGLASGLALAVRPAGLAEVSGAQGRVPLTLEGPARTMRGVPVPSP